MKNSKVIAMLILILNAGCSSNRSFFLKASREITLRYSIKKRHNLFEEARNKVYNYAPFLKTASRDTIYIIETYEIETGSVYGGIHCKDNFINYFYRKIKKGEELKLLPKSYFNIDESNAILKWDTLKINQDNKNADNILTDHIISAYRIYKENGLIHTDKFSFKEYVSKYRP